MPEEYRSGGRERNEVTIVQTPAVTNYFLLAIGIDLYTGGLNKLNNAVGDAQKVAEVLGSKYKFEKERIFGLYDNNASRTNITTHITNIYNLLGANDALLIYFAGHGVYSCTEGEFYLATVESNIVDFENDSCINSFLPLSAFYNRFKKYNDLKKCRDLFIVVDACFSGGGLLGYRGERIEGLFSRDILTSSLAGQPASDGIKGRGSAFANAFVDILIQNDENVLSFGSSILEKMTSKLSASADKMFDKQQLDFGTPPGTQIGRGSFTFEKREQSKPDIFQLKESLINYLDFSRQRSDMEEFYKKELNYLNIITTQGQSLSVHKVLSKIVFRWLSENEKISFTPGLSYTAEPVKIDLLADENVWRTLYKQIKDSSVKDDNKAIMQWYFDKMKSDIGRQDGTRHVILWIGFELGGGEIFKRLISFFEEFSQIFLEQFNLLDSTEKKKYGKMFLIVSDERTSAGDPHKSIFEKLCSNQKYNFIPTEQVSGINDNHAKKWISSFKGEYISKKLQEIRDMEIYRTWIEKEDAAKYETFIQKICTHCMFTPGEVRALNDSLYNFNNQSLI